MDKAQLDMTSLTWLGDRLSGLCVALKLLLLLMVFCVYVAFYDV